MSKLADQAYLRDEQYNDASKFNARVALHKRFSTNPYDFVRWTFDQLLDLPDHCRVLELGCGPAYLWRDNADRIAPGWQITLTDFSPGMIEQALHNLSAIDRAFAFEVVDAQSIPFGDAHFDVVIANHMLYHVPNRERAYSEIHRVLRTGGTFFTATNGRTHLRELHELAHRIDPQTRSWGGVSSVTFLLETGGAEIGRWFDQIELRRYPDGLIVPEAEPLADFIASMADDAWFDHTRRQHVIDQIAAEIAANGPIHISKDAGIFIATRPDRH